MPAFGRTCPTYIVHKHISIAYYMVLCIVCILSACMCACYPPFPDVSYIMMSDTAAHASLYTQYNYVRLQRTASVPVELVFPLPYTRGHPDLSPRRVIICSIHPVPSFFFSPMLYKYIHDIITCTTRSTAVLSSNLAVKTLFYSHYMNNAIFSLMCTLSPHAL